MPIDIDPGETIEFVLRTRRYSEPMNIPIEFYIDHHDKFVVATLDLNIAPRSPDYTDQAN